MPSVLAIDLICAGRALLNVCPEDREALAIALVSGAWMAECHRKRTGLTHPKFGAGTLADAARLFGMASEPTVCDLEFAEALVCVLQAVMNAKSVNHRLWR